VGPGGLGCSSYWQEGFISSAMGRACKYYLFPQLAAPLQIFFPARCLQSIPSWCDQFNRAAVFFLLNCRFSILFQTKVPKSSHIRWYQREPTQSKYSSWCVPLCAPFFQTLHIFMRIWYILVPHLSRADILHSVVVVSWPLGPQIRN